MFRSVTAVLAIGTAGCLGPSTSKEADAPPNTAAAARERSTTGTSDLVLCVIENGELKAVEAAVDALRGDTLVDGRPLREAHPVTLPPYARDAPWLAREIIVLRGRYYYAPHGPPQVIEPQLLTRVGEFRSVPVFAEAGTGEEVPSAIFVPLHPGCEFQPYVANVDFR